MSDYDHQGRTPESVEESGWFGGWCFVVLCAILLAMLVKEVANG